LLGSESQNPSNTLAQIYGRGALTWSIVLCIVWSRTAFCFCRLDIITSSCIDPTAIAAGKTRVDGSDGKTYGVRSSEVEAGKYMIQEHASEMSKIQIWVDADACPNPIKEILYRAAKRVEILTTFVANQELQIPASPYIKAVQVRSGLDIADNYIVELLRSGDLVITADIPLAAEAIAKGAVALNPRGEFYSEGNIRERLSLRNFMEALRSGGVDTGGPPAFGHRDRQAFANQLDRFLIRR
jgi:uncharacterized protein